MKVYVDTNIFIDYLEDRNSQASYFIIDALLCHHNIVISDLTLKELEHNGFHTMPLLALLKPKLELRLIRDEHKLAARNILTHYADALHIVMSFDCDLLLTRNLKDFYMCPKAGSYDKISKDL
jgi:predicted nucleic acid-binding protein